MDFIKITPDNVNEFYNKINSLIDEYFKWNIDANKLSDFLKPNSQGMKSFIERNGLSNVSNIEKIIRDVVEDRTSTTNINSSTFSKILAALNVKELLPDWKNCDDDFFIYYTINNLDRSKLVTIFNRFKSLSNIINNMNESSDYGLYIGIKYSGYFLLEYGLLDNNNKIVMGDTKLTESSFTKIKGDNSRIGNILKSVNISVKDMNLLMKCKMALLNYNPGYYDSKSKVTIKDNIITIGYYGLGKWDNGVIDENLFEDIKSNFKSWLLIYKWSDLLMVSVKPNRFWIYFSIKIKN